MIAKIYKASKKNINFALENHKKQGKTRNMRFFRLIYCKQEENLKFSAIVPKKVAKSAPKRNKIKRMIYDSVKDAGISNFSDGIYIFSCVKGVENASFKEISLEIKGLLS